jgi:hypothetical protein
VVAAINSLKSDCPRSGMSILVMRKDSLYQ